MSNHYNLAEPRVEHSENRCDLCHEVVEKKLCAFKQHRICAKCMKIVERIFGEIAFIKVMAIDWPSSYTIERRGCQAAEHHNLLFECKKCGGLMFAYHVSKWKVLNKFTNETKSPLRRFVMPLECSKCGSCVDLFILGYVNEYMYVNDKEVKIKDYNREKRIREGRDWVTNCHHVQNELIEQEEENKKLRQEIEKLKKASTD